MSNYLERLVRERSKLTGSDFAVLLAIAHYADDTGKSAFPSIATLAKDARRCRRTVQYAIERAVQLGELKRIYNYGPHGTNCYEIRLERLNEVLLCTGAKSAHKGSSLKGNYSYSSLRSSSRASSVQTTESVATPKPKSWRLWAKRGDPDWQCPICLKVGCSGCPGYMTDEELNASFDAAVRDTVDIDKPGPAQLASEAAMRAAYQNSFNQAMEKPGDNPYPSDETARRTHFHALQKHS